MAVRSIRRLAARIALILLAATLSIALMPFAAAHFWHMPSQRSVRIGPGFTPLTRIPCGAPSFASDFVTLSSAAFAAPPIM